MFLKSQDSSFCSKQILIVTDFVKICRNIGDNGFHHTNSGLELIISFQICTIEQSVEM